MEEKRILITGGSGLLGNALKKKLEKFDDLKKQNDLLKQQLKDIEKEILKKKNKQ